MIAEVVPESPLETTDEGSSPPARAGSSSTHATRAGSPRGPRLLPAAHRLDRGGGRALLPAGRGQRVRARARRHHRHVPPRDRPGRVPGRRRRGAPARRGRGAAAAGLGLRALPARHGAHRARCRRQPLRDRRRRGAGAPDRRLGRLHGRRDRPPPRRRRRRGDRGRAQSRTRASRLRGPCATRRGCCRSSELRRAWICFVSSATCSVSSLSSWVSSVFDCRSSTSLSVSRFAPTRGVCATSPPSRRGACRGPPAASGRAGSAARRTRPAARRAG